MWLNRNGLSGPARWTEIDGSDDTRRRDNSYLKSTSSMVTLSDVVRSASMGPRLFSVDDTLAAGRRQKRASMGPRLFSVDDVSVDSAPERDHRASMGPRLFSVDDGDGVAKLITRNVTLQWGHACSAWMTSSEFVIFNFRRTGFNGATLVQRG